MSPLRLGCDLCHIDVVHQMLTEDHAAMERLFAAEERAYALARQEPAQHLAGIFAAKEALVKAVRDSSLLGPYHREVTVAHLHDGSPVLRCSEALNQRLSSSGIRIVDCSISHDGAYAIAAVLIEVAVSEGTPLRCSQCLLTLVYLKEQRIADVLIQAVGPDGNVVMLCPTCLRGW